jgi:hypothetical protein
MNLSFLIPGAARSGKMAMCKYLNLHNEIEIINPSEPNYFCHCHLKKPIYKSKDHLYHEYIINNKAQYWQLFNNDKISYGDSSGSYLYYSKVTIKNIKNQIQDYKNIKIIILIRNPLERMFSSYMHYKMHGFEELTFLDAIRPETIKRRRDMNWSGNYDYVGHSMYYENVATYIDEFPNVKIVLYKDLLKQPNEVVNSCVKFLGFNDTVSIKQNNKTNISGLPKSIYLQNILSNKYNPTRKLIGAVTRKIFPLSLRNNVKAYLRYNNLKTVDRADYYNNKCYELFENDISKLSVLLNISEVDLMQNLK